jgi:phage regulator Rha-like protein
MLDSDVASLYGVETMRINEAVKNNPNKFPDGYIIGLESEEWKILKSKFSISSWGGKNKLPNAFTEQGLYMLATILKGEKAVNTTIEIIETFVKMRSLSESITELMQDHDNKEKQQAVAEKGEALFAEIIEDALDKVDTETSFELNLAAIKIKHTVRKSKNVK